MQTGEATCPKSERRKQSQDLNPGHPAQSLQPASLSWWGGYVCRGRGAVFSPSFLSRSHTPCCAEMSQLLPPPACVPLCSLALKAVLSGPLEPHRCSFSISHQGSDPGLEANSVLTSFSHLHPCQSTPAHGSPGGC